MKERIKSFLLHLLIIYALFIVISSTIALIKYPIDIKLEDREENLLKFYDLKNEASLVLKNNECHNAIKEVIDYYEDTSYSGSVSLKEYDLLSDKKTPLNVGMTLVRNCSQYNEKFNEKNIKGKILASAMLYEEIFYKSNIFKYEITLKDVYLRKYYESDTASVEYDSERKLQLEIIEELLEIVREDN